MDEIYTQLLESCWKPNAQDSAAPAAAGSLEGILQALGGLHIGASRAPHELPKYRPFSFDIESTGLSSRTARIIEVAIVDVRAYLQLQDTAQGNDTHVLAAAGNVAAAHWSSLVNPQGVAIDYHASKCHGIRTCDVSAPGVPHLGAAWHAITAFVDSALLPGERPLLVAHNGYKFDFIMLRNNLGLFDSDAPAHWLALDTYVMARALSLREAGKLSSLQQGALVEHFLGAAPVEAHRALADAQQLALVLPHLLRWAAGVAGSLVDEKLLPKRLNSFASKPTATEPAQASAARATAAVNVSSCQHEQQAASSSTSSAPAPLRHATSSSIADEDPMPYFLTITTAGRQPRVVEALRPQRFVQLVAEPGGICVDTQCLASHGGVVLGGARFADIRLARSNGPVAVMLRGAKLSKAITKQCYYIDQNGSLSSLKLHLQLDRDQEELASAIDALGCRAADVCSVHMPPCQVGTGKKPHLQVSLNCTKQPTPMLSTVVGHVARTSRERRALPPISLADGAAALGMLQRLLPSGSRCDAVVSPSCVWVNGSKGGVALKLLEVWLHQP